MSNRQCKSLLLYCASALVALSEKHQLSAFSSHSIESLFSTERMIAGTDQTKVGLQNAFLKMLVCGTYFRASHRAEGVNIDDFSEKIDFFEFDVILMRFAMTVM